MKGLLTQNFNKHYLSGSGNRLSSNYTFNKGSNAGNTAMLNSQRNRMRIINHFFRPLKNVLSSKPVFRISVNKVVISLFYYTAEKDEALNVNTINNLGHLLTKIFGRPVELRFVKLKYPYLDRTILAKFIRLNGIIHKFRRIRKWTLSALPVFKDRKFEDKSMRGKYPFSTCTLGIKVKISGRLDTERIKPRMTVLSGKVGSFKNESTRLVDYGTHTAKNSLGAFTVKVWINQKIVE